MLTWDIWGCREKSISYFSLLLIGIILPSVNSLCSHCEERTADIFRRMLEAQMTLGSLWHQGRQFRATHNPIHVTGPEATTNSLIVSLTLHRQAINRESKWTAHDWAGHCTQQVSKGKDTPCVPINISWSFENPTHHIPMLVHNTFYTPKKCYVTALQFTSCSIWELPHKLCVHLCTPYFRMGHGNHRYLCGYYSHAELWKTAQNH